MGVDEKCHGKEIGCAARTETPEDEVLVDGLGVRAPAGPAHAALIYEKSSHALCESKAIKAAAMQQIGIFDRSDESETSLDARGFPVFRKSARSFPEGRQADLINAGKSARGLDSRSARAKLAACSAAMTAQ